MSAQRLIEKQRSIINSQQREIARLREEIMLCKATVKQVVRDWQIPLPEGLDLALPEEKQESWRTKYQRFDLLRRRLLEAAVIACRAEQNAVHQDEIIREFTRRNRQLAEQFSSPGETFPRRLRELRELGFLESPQQAYYFPTPHWR